MLINENDCNSVARENNGIRMGLNLFFTLVTRKIW